MHYTCSRLSAESPLRRLDTGLLVASLLPVPLLAIRGAVGDLAAAPARQQLDTWRILRLAT